MASLGVRSDLAVRSNGDGFRLGRYTPYAVGEEPNEIIDAPLAQAPFGEGAEPAARRGRFDPLQSEQKHQHQRQPNSPGNHGSRAEIRTGIAHAAELLRE
jgi:hypothetical protein